ncbi:uncharacterized protein J4E88_001516 [Alternaria novae-zelandiae]|uniref:uncharacterized protein n=1 Tax=Alternaria novae-zelandiae TaxID=430562 RepID=UPI0020C3B936|nr:uncharacterized protein J4E88_001516 [Alternaria novae-zelandiae]KAI4693145.1 hypothetical protein J4E88_001516 [Alternaria novae-zelandiae]
MAVRIKRPQGAPDVLSMPGLSKERCDSKKKRRLETTAFDDVSHELSEDYKNVRIASYAYSFKEASQMSWDFTGNSIVDEVNLAEDKKEARSLQAVALMRGTCATSPANPFDLKRGALAHSPTALAFLPSDLLQKRDVQKPDDASQPERERKHESDTRRTGNSARPALPSLLPTVGFASRTGPRFV